MVTILAVLLLIGIGVWRIAFLLVRMSGQLHGLRVELRRALTSEEWYGDFHDAPLEDPPFYLVPMLVRQMDRVRQDFVWFRDKARADRD